MKRFALTATALLLLAAPAAADAGRTSTNRHERQILVRGTVLVVAPITVRASLGATVTCQVRNRKLIANLAVGDHVRMKCVAVDGRLVLRRLAINPPAPPRDASTEPASGRPDAAPADRARGPVG